MRFFNDLQARGERLKPPKSSKTSHFVDRIADRNSSILKRMLRRCASSERANRKSDDERRDCRENSPILLYPSRIPGKCLPSRRSGPRSDGKPVSPNRINPPSRLRCNQRNKLLGPLSRIFTLIAKHGLKSQGQQFCSPSAQTLLRYHS